MSAAALHNPTKTAVALGVFGAACVGFGHWWAGGVGASMALVAGLILVLASARWSDTLVLWATDARWLGKGRPGQDLVDVLTPLAMQVGLPVPRLAVTEDAEPNAYAAGDAPQRAIIVVTSGLLELPTAALRGALAHEVMHLHHRDLRAGALAAGTSLLGAFALVMVLPATILVVPVAAVLGQLALSRRRERAADRDAAELLGSGQPLAEALAAVTETPRAGRIPELLAVHPAPSDRIRRLEALAARPRNESEPAARQLPGS